MISQALVVVAVALPVVTWALVRLHDLVARWLAERRMLDAYAADWGFERRSWRESNAKLRARIANYFASTPPVAMTDDDLREPSDEDLVERRRPAWMSDEAFLEEVRRRRAMTGKGSTRA